MRWRRAKIAYASRDASWAPRIPGTSIYKTTYGALELHSRSPEERSMPMLSSRRGASAWGALASRCDRAVLV